MHDWGQHNRPGQGIIKGTVSRECSKYPINGTVSRECSKYPIKGTVSRECSKYLIKETVSRECSKYPIKGTVSGVQRGYKFATAVFFSDLPIH